VRIADIIEDYLGVLTEADGFDLEVATEFLVVAATLLEIKSHRLLPSPSSGEDGADDLSDRDLLIARLLQYKAFKDAAAHLAERIAANVGYHARTIGPGADFAYLAPDLLARCPLPRFVEIARGALAPRIDPVLDLSHLTPIRITLAEAIATVEALLATRRRITFRELNGDSADRLEIVVRFLAVLELMKAGTVEASQAETFGEIEIRAVDDPARAAPTPSVREDA
jgi:segregation and condensation protein A